MSTTSFIILCVVGFACFFICVTFAASDGDFFDYISDWISSKKNLYVAKKVVNSYKKGNVVPLLKQVCCQKCFVFYDIEYHDMSQKQREQCFFFKYLLYSARYLNENKKNSSDFERLQYVIKSIEDGLCAYEAGMPDEFAKELNTLTAEELNKMELSDTRVNYIREQLSRYNKKAGVQ